MTLRPLRPHQERALADLRASIASGHRRPMLSLPTGAGKTRIAADIARGALSKGKRDRLHGPGAVLDRPDRRRL